MSNQLSPHEASILGLWLADWHVEAIAARYGITVQAVLEILRVARLKLDGSEQRAKVDQRTSNWSG